MRKKEERTLLDSLEVLSEVSTSLRNLGVCDVRKIDRFYWSPRLFWSSSENNLL